MRPRQLSMISIVIPMMILALIFVGCASSRGTASAVVANSAWAQERDVKIPEGNWSEEFSDDQVQAEIDEPKDTAQPVPAKGEKLNFQLLDKLDGKNLHWWIHLNKKHEPTTIPGYAQDLLKKYDGVFLGDPSKKVVYLTFDEGYENGYTPMILDTLKKNDVKALFFITGPYLNSYGNLVKRMLDEGHMVGNHTIHHPSLPDVSDTKLENELCGMDTRFFALSGKHFEYMRPPRGEYSEKVLSAAQQLGYKTVFWSYAYVDYDIHAQKGPDHAYQMVMDNLHNGEVLLLHAVSSDNAQALDRIIKGIKAEGYTISPFDQ